MENLTQNDEFVVQESSAPSKMQRRSFLKYAGAGAAAAGMLVASACKKHHDDNNTVDVGSGDIGVLNYAYALEQLEAAFYTQVVATPYSGMSPAELTAFTEIRDHEVLHREFLKAALGVNAIPALGVNFGSINFADRASVLAAAKAFEDTGVSAYNGAGYIISNSTYLGLAGKIVSVEARHAAFIRDLINYNSFADSSVIVDSSTGLDTSRKPSQVLPIVAVYLTTNLTANQLP
ncbi:Tat (twin-arginine translocation) pathway signal sequence containing protein [Mucilaginibacter sp. PPCGB 2223]|uniref:ferritin-like domain-containing protein n=1 Tax=Mucilaginibacter sp. PPCGB 2223 TaxID=1886027 RepID=UPI0008244D7C|nr:ferritin-like domain-containing protein [Mucilaginibacter sp. PPCGB 2223]OCX50876.1 Tat (twin-arginine translocation) pathway signal sequence containing protein [Mucilaginibacter sp. PPCGB 2223]